MKNKKKGRRSTPPQVVIKTAGYVDVPDGTGANNVGFNLIDNIKTTMSPFKGDLQNILLRKYKYTFDFLHNNLFHPASVDFYLIGAQTGATLTADGVYDLFTTGNFESFFGPRVDKPFSYEHVGRIHTSGPGVVFNMSAASLPEQGWQMGKTKTIDLTKKLKNFCLKYSMSDPDTPELFLVAITQAYSYPTDHDNIFWEKEIAWDGLQPKVQQFI